MACLDASLGAPYRPRPFEVGWSRSEVSEMCPKGSPNSGSHSIMPKPTKTELTKYRDILKNQLASLKGDVGSMRDEALRASDQDASVDHLADQGTDNYDQGFMLGLIENEEETIKLIEEALDRIDGQGDWDYGICPLCFEASQEASAKAGKKKAKKADAWIPKARLEYLPWARYCVQHQESEERNRESA